MLFRTIALCMLLATSGGAVLAQFHVAHEPGKVAFLPHSGFDVRSEGLSDAVIQKVRSALNLSDVQVNALKTLVTMREQSIEQVMESVGDIHRKLEELVNQPNPNPTDVGTAFLATRSIEDKTKAVEEKFRTDVRAMLTPDQRSTLDRLNAASEQINALRQAGVIEGGFMEHFGPISMPAIEPFAIGFHRSLSKED
jgi:uncharacterized protein YqgV (UPF0045/DUF77 family)